MRTKVSNLIEKYEMVSPGDTIVVGVSGGADSVCLLFLLCEKVSCSKNSFNIEVVHVNHMLRDTAKRDEDFVKSLCENLAKRFGINIPFHIANANVSEMAEKMGISTEEAGRMIRYDAMRKVLGDRQGKIAVAHHANDQAETMLFNLFRGSGIKGISGISEVNGNIIRPLLNVTREEIEEFLKEENLEYVVDETNLTDEYTRNKIRHHIIEYAEENIVNGAVMNMAKAAAQLRSADSFITECTLKAALRCTLLKEEGRIEINTSLLLKEHEYIVNHVLYDAISYVAGKKKDITSTHVSSVRNLLDTTGSKEVHLPYHVVAKKEYEKLCISLSEAAQIEEEEFSFDMRVLEKFRLEDIPKDIYTKWFDYDKISSVATVRTRKEGDYLMVNSDMNKKSLKSYFINEKVPKEKRDSIKLLADGSHIMWVIGMRISEYYKVDENTTRVLEVKYGRED